MLKHGSATAREQTPHANQTTKTTTTVNALKWRAQAIVNDKSIDAQSRTIIRYGLEINDPLLPELVRRVDAGGNIDETFDFSQTPAAVEDASSQNEGVSGEETIEGLAEIICRADDRSAPALLVLMHTLQNSRRAKLLANKAKHYAFTYCAELDLYGIVHAQVAVFERELWNS